MFMLTIAIIASKHRKTAYTLKGFCLAMDCIIGDQLELVMKAVTVGDYSSGKTTLCYCLNYGRRPEVTCQTTIGVDFSLLEWKLDQNDSERTTKIQLFDTAGMEKFRSISESYFQSANVFLIVADTTKELGKEWEDRWVNRCQKTPQRPEAFPRKTILVASKVDQLPDRDLNHNENIKRLKLLAATRGFYFVMTTIERVPAVIDDFCVIMSEIWTDFEKYHKEERNRPKMVVLKPGNDEVDGWALEHRCQC